MRRQQQRQRRQAAAAAATVTITRKMMREPSRSPKDVLFIVDSQFQMFVIQGVRENAPKIQKAAKAPIPPNAEKTVCDSPY